MNNIYLIDKYYSHLSKEKDIKPGDIGLQTKIQYKGFSLGPTEGTIAKGEGKLLKGGLFGMTDISKIPKELYNPKLTDEENKARLYTAIKEAYNIPITKSDEKIFAYRNLAQGSLALLAPTGKTKALTKATNFAKTMYLTQLARDTTTESQSEIIKRADDYLMFINPLIAGAMKGGNYYADIKDKKKGQTNIKDLIKSVAWGGATAQTGKFLGLAGRGSTLPLGFMGAKDAGVQKHIFNYLEEKKSDKIETYLKRKLTTKEKELFLSKEAKENEYGFSQPQKRKAVTEEEISNYAKLIKEINDKSGKYAKRRFLFWDTFTDEVKYDLNNFEELYMLGKLIQTGTPLAFKVLSEPSNRFINSKVGRKLVEKAPHLYNTISPTSAGKYQLLQKGIKHGFPALTGIKEYSKSIEEGLSPQDARLRGLTTYASTYADVNALLGAFKGLTYQDLKKSELYKTEEGKKEFDRTISLLNKMTLHGQPNPLTKKDIDAGLKEMFPKLEKKQIEGIRKDILSKHTISGSVIQKWNPTTNKGNKRRRYSITNSKNK